MKKNVIKRQVFKFISSLRGSVFLNGIACFMAFSVFFVSCTQGTLNLPNTPTESSFETSNGYLSMIPESESELSEFGSHIEQLGEFTVSGKFSKQKVVDYVNSKSQELGYEDAIDIEFFDEIMSAEFFLTSSSSMNMFFLNLKEKNRISDREFVILDNLDQKVINSQNDIEIRTHLKEFQDNLSSDLELTNFEKERMLAFITIIGGVMEPYLAKDGVVNNRDFIDCIDCIIKNKWKIGIFTTLSIIVAVAGCAYAQAQTGFPIGLCLQGVWLLFGGIIAGVCGKSCFGDPEPVCEDPECPPEFDNSFDNGFTCCTDEMEGTSVVTGQNGDIFLSTVPNGNGNCSSGWTFVQFTQTCMKVMDVGWENLQVRDNMFCVTANNCN